MYRLSNRYSRVAAFTIVEALLSMAITAIILAIVFVLFSVTSQRLMDFEKQNEKVADLNRLSYTINKAIFESAEMHLIDDRALIFKDASGAEVRYLLSEGYFIREQGEFLDTFHLETLRISIDVLKGKSGKYRYQRLMWGLRADKRKIDLCFYRKIYADELLKLAIKDEF